MRERARLRAGVGRLLAEELFDGIRIVREPRAREHGGPVGRGPDAVAEGVPGRTLTRGSRDGMGHRGRTRPAGTPPARLIDDVRRPPPARQNRHEALAAIRRGFVVAPGLADAVPQDHRPIVRPQRDEKLRVTMVAVKRLARFLPHERPAEKRLPIVLSTIGDPSPERPAHPVGTAADNAPRLTHTNRKTTHSRLFMPPL